MPDSSAHTDRGHPDAPLARAEPAAGRSVTDIVDQLFARFDEAGAALVGGLLHASPLPGIA